MFELTIKQVKLFKFVDLQRGSQINIYVEPLTDRTGRLIISTPYRIFQRYFDEASGGIYDFLIRAGVQSIAYAFINCTNDDHAYLLKHLPPIGSTSLKAFLNGLSRHNNSKNR